MDRKEDIGKLFEEKLQQGNASPQTTSWDTLKDSLDEKDRKKKKRLFFLWLTGASTALLLLYLLAASVSKKNSPNSLQEDITVWELDSLSNKTDSTPTYRETEEVFKIVTKDRLKSSEKGGSPSATESAVSETSDNKKKSSEESLKDATNTTLKEEVSEKKTSGTQKSDHTLWTEKSDQVKTKYYYYNDSTKQNMVIEDPKVIDSILKNTQKTKDSINE
ncbi:MAG: hypothetical protein CL596_08640 [Alteromonas sp.]|nr:hypothetical protein [Alteromonas sp.]MAY23408.1 hypothetical protein [Flavobacteriaceae bacterium]|tara:strand:- start:8197 stop:8853 length:657 start_codon:yes stop_codon:yes gene_type:complete